MVGSNDPMDSNPGRQLQLLLKEIFPPDAQHDTSFIWRIDDAVMADGQLVDVIYNGTINYLLRRLITTAEYFRRKCADGPFTDPEHQFKKLLKDFLREEIRIPRNRLGRFEVLLRECLEARARYPTEHTKKRLLKKAGLQGDRCYICGAELEYRTTFEHSGPDEQDASREEESQYNTAQVEHYWPRALGGLSEETNLKAACASCNLAKKDYIDASDFHFEEFCLVSSREHENFFKEFTREFRVAVLARNEFRCAVCGQRAEQIGELVFGRRNPNDSWHFLNVITYCDKHSCKA